MSHVSVLVVQPARIRQPTENETNNIEIEPTNGPLHLQCNAIVDERHEERRKEEDIIMMDPEIAAVFNAS